MKRSQQKPTYPLTAADKNFMKNLLAGVRSKRDEAVSKKMPVIVRQEGKR